jgi:peptidoglycan/LPS O-acetylase OafA/YrhL
MSIRHRNHIIKHRSDIDGLRAFAIIPVLFFHSGFTLFSGGFVGVDIFFTISGFLITSILLKDIDNNRFSYTEFFKRRIRRLMPMAILIYIFVLSLFFFFYPSTFFKDVSAATFSSLLFFSNIYFWKEGGDYFGRNVEINPLLHTWSLSVEEQFYLIFPFLLLLLFWITRNATQKIVLIFIGILISVYVAIIYAPSKESFAAFYLLPPRMYELAIGSITALFVYYWPHHNLRKIAFLQEIGIFFVLIPIFFFDSNTLFPSYNALLPCSGAALIMLSTGNNGWSSILLNSRFAVFIGLISYSLYLWHWPLIVFKNWITDNESSFFIDFLVIAISILLSSITYKYVENPFRNKSIIPDRRLLLMAGISFITIGSISVILYLVGNDVMVDPTGRINSTYQEAIQAPPNRKPCFEKVRLTGKFASCELSNSSDNKEKRIFVWGDSHGSAFIPVLNELSRDHYVYFSNNSGCPPVLNIKRTDFSQSCARINRLIFENIIGKYDLVILVSAFSNYLNSGTVGQLDATHSRDPELAKKDFGKLISTTLDKFEKAGTQFLIIAQPPRMPYRIPERYLRSETLNQKYLGDQIKLSEYEAQISPLIESIPQKWHKNIVTFNDVFCPNKECISMSKNTLLYKDEHHISNAYTTYLSKHYTPVFEEKLKKIN